MYMYMYAYIYMYVYVFVCVVCAKESAGGVALTLGVLKRRGEYRVLVRMKITFVLFKVYCVYSNKVCWPS